MLNDILWWADQAYLHIGSFGGWIIVILMGYEVRKMARKTRG